MGSEYATDPSSPLSPNSSFGSSPTASAAFASGGKVMESMGAMLSPRSISRGGGGRSGSQMRGDSLGFEGRGRRKRGAKGLVRVAVDGVRGWGVQVGQMMGAGSGGGRF